MVSITLSVTPEMKQKMDKFPEMNWSGFVRGAIGKKTGELDWRQDMLERLKKEEAFDQWAVETVRNGRKGRHAGSLRAGG
jgi:hypothetical protein